MTERNPPVWMQSGTYQASDDRMVTGLLSSRSFSPVDGMTTRVDGGVVPGFDQLRAYGNGTNMQVTVGAGAVIVSPGPPGAYICFNDGPATVTFPIEGSGNPRIDLLVAEVSDPAVQGSGATSSWKLKIVPGTPGPAPETPTPQTGYQHPLAAVRVVPASLNSGTNKISQTQITDLRRFNTAPGGVHVKWEGTPFPNASPGRLCFDVTAQRLYINKTGVVGDWVDIYDQAQMKNVLSALRPQQITSSQTATVNNLATWDPAPKLGTSATQDITRVERTVKTPSQFIKVSLSAYGKVGENLSSGYMSVRVRDAGGNEKWAANFTCCLAFYSKNWAQSSTTFLVQGLEPGTYTVQCVFRRETAASGEQPTSGYAKFKNMLLMVEPVY